jgi:hypothetical protein
MNTVQEQSALDASVIIPARPDAVATRGVLRRIYQHWKRAAHAVGIVQTRAIMLVIYALVVVPTGLFMRLSRDPLHLQAPAETNFTPARQSERSVESARRQF